MTLENLVNRERLLLITDYGAFDSNPALYAGPPAYASICSGLKLTSDHLHDPEEALEGGHVVR